MAIKKIGIVILLMVFALAGFQVWGLFSARTPEVLSVTTTKTIEERVKSLEARVYTLEKNAGIGTFATKKATESYVSFSGGDISSFVWTKVPGSDFTFDTSLYGKTVEVSWQGWLQGGVGSVRLYDATNNRAVDFSDITLINSTNDTKSSFYSKVMSIWRGQNQYYVEGKTTNGTITLSAPRLKVVSK